MDSRPPTSLRSQLLAWLLVPLVCFVMLSAWLSYRNAVETANLVQDRMLLGSARIIGEQIRFEDGVVQVVIPPAALELFESSFRDRVYYRIASARGTMLSGYAELPPAPHSPAAEEAVYFDAVFRGTPIRIVAFAQPLFGAPDTGPVVIEVAETMQAHAALVREFWTRNVGYLLLLLVIAVVMLWIGLRHGLAPLMHLRDRVLERKPGALDALPAGTAPSELRPLVAALNDYVERLDSHMSAHSRFIANASHQLRTPLTLLNTQVTYALRSNDLAGKNDALAAINESVRHGIRIVNQMLTFSMAEARPGHVPNQADADLVATVKLVLEEHAAMAQARNIDLGFECSLASAMVRVAPALLRELTANLVDNAVRYTPSAGMVTAGVSEENGRVMLRVEDNGPGIPVAERERVFDRFYRIREDHSDGCGLGLSIVREIATASDAAVALSDPENGPGLVVTVVFPVVQRAP